MEFLAASDINRSSMPGRQQGMTALPRKSWIARRDDHGEIVTDGAGWQLREKVDGEACGSCQQMVSIWFDGPQIEDKSLPR